MPSAQVLPPFEAFMDVDGSPLEDGYIYIGADSMDPEANPIAAFFDSALSVPAPQPIRTKGGYPSNAGAPSRIYVGPSSYSVRVKNKNSTTIHSDLSITSPTDSSSISFIQAGQGAVERGAQEKMRDFVSVKDFGAIGDGAVHLLSERFSTLGSAQAEYPFVTSLSQSIDWAAIQSAINTGKKAFAPRGIYYISDTLVLDNGQQLEGEGTDVWEQLWRDLPKENGRGTHLIFYGTGSKVHTSPGVTSQGVSGGVIPNPEPVALDTNYSLTSFHNADASSGVASTLRTFSAAIHVNPASHGWAIRNLRLHPNFNGIAGYNNASLLTLADDWDVGIFADNAPYGSVQNVQAVGYWRIAGVYQMCVNRPGVQAQGYGCVYEQLNTQGMVGFLMRGGDTYRPLQATATTLDIPWQADHPFLNAGSFTSNLGSHNYTSTSKVVDGTFGEVLRFAGLSSNLITAGISQVRVSSGFGLGGLVISQSLISGLEHTSGNKASSFALGIGVSTAFEISGGFRQPYIDQTYIQSGEDVVLHCHNIGDLRFSQCQFEGNGRGGRILASPQDINNTIVPYASGDTNISIYQGHAAGVDMFPLVPRSVTLSTFTLAGFFNPRRVQNMDYQMPDSDALDFTPMLTQNARVNLPAGRQFLIRNTSLANLITVSESSGTLALVTGQLSFPTAGAAFINAGVGQVMNFRQGTTITWQIAGGATLAFGPGADATQNLASAALRINNSFFAVAPTVSSDAIFKKIRGDLNSAELAAWGSVRAKVYQMWDMVAEKGEDDARFHVGYVAQDVQQAFLDQGLDPARYGLWCEDEVTKTVINTELVEKQKTETVTGMVETIEMRDGVPVLVFVPEETQRGVTQQVPILKEDGSPATDAQGAPRYYPAPVMEWVQEDVESQVPDGKRLGLRYTECLVMETAYLRTIAEDHEQRIAALENGA